MRFLHASQQAKARGWELEDRESAQDKNGVEHPCSHVYAIRGEEEKLLCSFTVLWGMGREEWAALLATLPVEQQEEVSA